MRWNLWLAQPETERSLGTALRIVVAVTALWTAGAVYGVWSSRAALAAVQLSIVSQSNQMSQASRDLPAKRRRALEAAAVKVVSSRGAGSAEVTEELADLAQTAGAEVRGIRIGDGGKTPAATPAAPGLAGAGAAGGNPPGAGPGGAAPVSAGAPAGGDETFECNIVGEYPSLLRFLNGLAASHQILDITSLEVTQGDIKSRPYSPRLEMKISGTVYESPEKS